MSKLDELVNKEYVLHITEAIRASLIVDLRAYIEERFGPFLHDNAEYLCKLLAEAGYSRDANELEKALARAKEE